MKITEKDLTRFAAALRAEERSPATIEKYCREAARFAGWLKGQRADRELALAYKAELCGQRAPAGVNGAIAALNRFFDLLGLGECRLKAVRVQRRVFREEEKLSHRDFLGSLMGMGIVREKVGDILVAPGSADLLVLEGVADFLLQSWNSAGRAKLRVSAIEPENLHIPTVQRKEVRDTVSSLRLDAVAASGFRLARGKAAALIESGKVQLNWREGVKPDKLPEAGDVVSARGFGKFELSEVGGLTRKGRVSIVLRVYV